MNSKSNIDLNILLIKENNVWVAQCIDYDINAQGDTIPESINLLIETVAMRLAYDIENGIEPLSKVVPAPIMYYDLYNNEAIPLEKEFLFNIPSPSEGANAIHRGRTLARVC